MKRYQQKIQYVAGLIFGIFASLTVMAENEKTQTLVFLNWANYMDPALIEAFSKKYHVKVKEVYFDSDEDRTEMLLRTEGQGYDVVLTAGMDMANYQKKSWLHPVDTTRVPNLKHMDKRWLEAFDGSPQGVSVPVLWGSVGIIYQKDKITTPITSWSQLYKPDPVLKGHVHMLKDTQDILGLGLKSLGYSYNSTNRKQLKEVEQLLLAQKPWVSVYGMPVFDKSSGFVTGDYWMGMAYNGDALFLQEMNKNLGFVIPEEGTALWCDYLTVMSSSKNKELAFKFIDFLSEPENAVRLVHRLHFASPNKTAETLLSDKYLKNSQVYLSPAILERSETGKLSLPPRIKKYRTSIYNRLMQ